MTEKKTLPGGARAAKGMRRGISLYGYTWNQILILFFLYCFLGWVWESCFVSVRKGEWVNRGFLYGPVLPIYGFGAIIILGITYPVRESAALIFVFGMLGATALEYGTGAVMERLFHMRYWDYSNNPLNVHGYICLSCSLGWGVFSLLLVRVIDPAVERILAAVPQELLAPLSTALTVLISIDTVRSAQAAINLRELMEKMSENSAAIAAARARIEELSGTIAERYPELTERLNEAGERYREKKEEGREKKEELMQRIEALRLWTDEAMHGLGERLPGAYSENEREHMQTLRRALGQLLGELHRLEEEAVEKRDKELERAERLLKRNPSMASRQLKEALGELKELLRERREKRE